MRDAAVRKRRWALQQSNRLSRALAGGDAERGGS
jgi:hypothetical protein